MAKDNSVKQIGGMTLTRRDFLRASATTALAGLVAACVPPPVATPAVAPAVSKGEPVKVKLLTWFWSEPGRADAWRAMIKKFNESQSDVFVEEGGWPQDSYGPKMVMAAQSGKIEGDLFTCYPDLALRMIQAGVCEPLEDIIEKNGIKDLSKSHDSLRKDGHLYGLDIVTVGFGLLYNKQMYDAAGITKGPTTPEEFLEVTEKLTKKPDQFGTFSGHVPSEPFQRWFVLQQWPVLYDGIWAKDRTPMVTSDPIIKGLKLFKQMYDCCMPQGTDSGTATKMYATSRIAQMLVVSPSVNVWKTEGPDVYPHLRSVPPPSPNKKAITRIHPIHVYNGSPNKEAAKAFVEWLYKPENYRELLERCLDVIPAFPDGIRKEYLDSLHWAEGYLAAVPITLPEIMGEFVFYNDEFGGIVWSKFDQCLTANKPVEDAMAEAQTELEAMGARVFS